MLKGDKSGNQISRPIVWLAIIGITLGVTVMILSVSIAAGFQNEIRDKVIGFGGHIQITEGYSNFSFESTPMLSEQEFNKPIAEEASVMHIQDFAYKPAIIQSKEVTDTIEGNRDISGIVFKGAGEDFYADFFRENLLEGHIPKYTNKATNDSILISKYTSNKLQLGLHEKIAVFFIKEDGPKQRNLIISGIYETGLEDFDKQFAICDINQIRKVNDWGITTHLIVREDMQRGYPILEAIVTGGNENYRYSWNNGSYDDGYLQPFCPIQDTTIQLVATDFQSQGYLSEVEPVSVPDTAWLRIHIDQPFICDHAVGNASFDMEYINDSTTKYTRNGISFTTTLTTSGGSGRFYTGGKEVVLKTYDDLFNAEEIIQRHVTMEYNVSSIVVRNEEIFNWLGMLDMNVYIIIGLMVLVAIINMSAALLVLILERTQMIGILKALGGTNWNVRKIFLYNGGYLITKGLLFGNMLAFGLIFLQHQFEIITLPQANYYVSVVPMAVPVLSLLLVNLGAFVVCYLSLILPSYMITRISPVKAIRME